MQADSGRTVNIAYSFHAVAQALPRRSEDEKKRSKKPHTEAVPGAARAPTEGTKEAVKNIKKKKGGSSKKSS
jgi:hypothetical protein